MSQATASAPAPAPASPPPGKPKPLFLKQANMRRVLYALAPVLAVGVYFFLGRQS